VQDTTANNTSVISWRSLLVENHRCSRHVDDNSAELIFYFRRQHFDEELKLLVCNAPFNNTLIMSCFISGGSRIIQKKKHLSEIT